MIRLVPSWAKHYEEFWVTIRKRNLWFIKLRYGAVLMLMVFILFPKYFLDVHLSDDQANSLLIVTFTILFYNAFLHFIRRFLKHDADRFNPLHLSVLQMLFDLIALMIVVYYTGSIESPLLLFFVIHMIVGSLILPGFLIYGFAVSVIIVVWVITVGEYYSIIPHHHVYGYLPFHLHQHFNYVLAINTTFGFMVFLIVLISNRMAKQLYMREQQLIESIQKINAAEAEKQKYIIGVVHEIKTPLAAVHSYLDLVLQKFLGPLDEIVEEKLKRAKRRSDEAIELINSILKISNMKLFDKITRETMQIDLILKSTVASQMVNARAKNVSIKVRDGRDEKKPILGDSFLIQIAISNVINNAIKYVDFEGMIEILIENKSESVVISFCDNGIGIPEKDISKIFNDFYRASNIRDKNYEGSGIGLPVVKQIIEKHGGTIKVDSPSRLATTDKPGTCFIISLPFKED
jgi:signal transduction histidine kinase